MKRLLAGLLMVILLTGCKSGSLDKAMAMRQRLLDSNGCTFDAIITADYGDTIHTFQMYCEVDSKGDMVFTVTDPETISGIAGTIKQEGGNLTFDDHVLVFEMLADGQITPVSAPWLLIRSLRSGYISACGEEDDGLRIAVDDSYEEDALHLDVWLDNQDLPVRGEILWQGQRVVSLEVRNFLYV